MRISFTTLGCPNWDLDTILEKAAEYGFDGIDFRGTRSGIDVTLQPEFGRDLEKTARRIRDAGLVVSGVSSSIRICDESLREANVEEACRTIPVALALGARQVRVFGYGDIGRGRTSLLEQGQRCMEAIRSLEGAEDVDWLLETHDLWIESPNCLQLLDAVNWDRFGLLWDIGHTTRVGPESLVETFAQVKALARCVHLKDAVMQPYHPHAMKDGWRYVLPGKGQLPIGAAVTLLESSGYDGWYVFEHEKRWHPELAEPEAALPVFVEWIRGQKG